MDILFLLTVVPAYFVGSFFINNDPGPEEPRSAISSAVGFGFIAIILALVFSFGFELLVSGDFLARISSVDNDTPLPLFIDVLIFASIEELVKFIPLSIFLLKKDFFNELTDGIIYFSIVGLTFGAIESLLYSLTSGSFGIVVALVRLALGLFFHGALTAVVGYYFAKSKVTKSSMFVVFLILLAVSLLHAGYNYSLYNVQDNPLFIFGAAGITLCVNIAMFILYFKAAKKDTELGLAGPQFKAERQRVADQRAAEVQRQYTQPPQATVVPQQPKPPDNQQPGV